MLTGMYARHVLAETDAWVRKGRLKLPPRLLALAPPGWTLASLRVMFSVDTPDGPAVLSAPALLLATPRGKRLWLSAARAPHQLRAGMTPDVN